MALVLRPAECPLLHGERSAKDWMHLVDNFVPELIAKFKDGPFKSFDSSELQQQGISDLTLLAACSNADTLDTSEVSLLVEVCTLQYTCAPACTMRDDTLSPLYPGMTP